MGVERVPLQIELEMYAEKPILLPFFTGHVSRGLLLHVLRRVNPSLARALHEADKPKPYAVTPLRFKSREKTDKGYWLDPNFPCRVRFKFLRDEIAKSLLEYFYKNTSVLIYDTVFQVASLNVKNESYEDLWSHAEEPGKAFRLVFLTPTYLATLGTDYHYLFPDHTRICPSLMRLWNLFSDHKRFGKNEVLEYKEWLLKNMGVSKHKLSTRTAFMREKKANGFVGWAEYEMKVLDEWSQVTLVFARFAEYSNIGGNRTGGFGVIKQKTKLQGEEDEE